MGSVSILFDAAHSMTKLSKEFWVGCLLLFVVFLMLVFGSLMGVLGPFTREARFGVLYDFAGGVEVGAPVRVAGVKVGKVEAIEFRDVKPGAEKEPSLKVTVSIAKRALPTVRTDSRFFINMAGIIGERYVEVSPGVGEPLVSGAVVRGVDPPRIDQLLSQGYDVFGRIAEFLDKKQGTFAEFLDQLSALITDANEFLKGKENRKVFFSLLTNLNSVTSDLKEGFKDEEVKSFFRRLREIVKRAEQIDKPALKQFLQEEGVRAHIF
jgi:phospholipid/cholesterol/gamma-HCH transport system substrate-binding protein